MGAGLLRVVGRRVLLRAWLEMGLGMCRAATSTPSRFPIARVEAATMERRLETSLQHVAVDMCELPRMR